MDATIGHNLPPTPIEELRSRLALETAALAARCAELLGGVERAPIVVTDDDAAGKTGDLIKLLTVAFKGAEATRVATKEPHLEMGRAVDGFFKRLTDPVVAAKGGLQKRLDAYLVGKAAAARRTAEEEARLARARAQLLEAEALARELAAKPSAPAAPVLDAAVAAEKVALAAEAVAVARPAALAQTRGDYGSVGSLRTVWTGEITDRAALDLETLRQHIALDALEMAVRSFVRAGGRELAGAKIYEKSTAIVR